MLDIQIFRDNPASIRADFSKRGIDDDPIDEVIRLDESWRQIRYEVDQLRKEKNSAARGIASAKKSGDEDKFKRIMDEVSNLGEMIENLESDARKMIEERDDIRMRIPNILIQMFLSARMIRRTWRLAGTGRREFSVSAPRPTMKSSRKMDGSISLVGPRLQDRASTS